MPTLDEHLKNHSIHAWQTNAFYSEHGQRIAAVLLPDERVYFFDIDRSIDGVSEMKMNRMYSNLREFVTHVYNYCHYSGGHYSIERKEWTHEDMMRLRDLMIAKAKECPPPIKGCYGL